MRESVGTPHPVLATAARHLIDAGGKRIRPCWSCWPHSSARGGMRGSPPRRWLSS
jgi:geranylgeranyl pyrophosphate synthase